MKLLIVYTDHRLLLFLKSISKSINSSPWKKNWFVFYSCSQLLTCVVYGNWQKRSNHNENSEDNGGSDKGRCEGQMKMVKG